MFQASPCFPAGTHTLFRVPFEYTRILASFMQESRSCIMIHVRERSSCAPAALSLRFTYLMRVPLHITTPAPGCEKLSDFWQCQQPQASTWRLNEHTELLDQQCKRSVAVIEFGQRPSPDCANTGYSVLSLDNEMQVTFAGRYGCVETSARYLCTTPMSV